MALNKFYKRKEIVALETSVGSALLDIENSSQEMKAALKFLLLSSVKDLTAQLGRKVLLVMIPFPCLKVFQKVSKKLVPELERRLKVTVFVTAKRTLDSKWVKKHRSQMRPRSRTLTAVYDGLLEDLCAPGSIIGRRQRVRIDGSRFFRVFLDQNDKEMEQRTDLIKALYKHMTTRDIEFEFKSDQIFYQLKQKKKNQPQQQ